MTTLILNTKLLNVLCAIEDRKKLAQSESILGLTDDWYADTSKYIDSLPQALTADLGLVKNAYCKNAILQFKVPPAWKEAETHELNQFQFCF